MKSGILHKEWENIIFYHVLLPPNLLSTFHKLFRNLPLFIKLGWISLIKEWYNGKEFLKLYCNLELQDSAFSA